MLKTIGLRDAKRRTNTDPAALLAALPMPILVIDEHNAIRAVNPYAEQLFGAGSATLLSQSLEDRIPADSPLFSLIENVRSSGSTVSDSGLMLEGVKVAPRMFAVQVAPLEGQGDCLICLHELSLAAKLDRHRTHRHAARSVTAMAAMMAHEVKNPLSGIKGAAQLLEQTASDADRELTRLICDEADRICALVDRMEVFSDSRPLERAPVNIHEVLERVRRVAQSGFARHIRFIETYDPSLPPVWGNRDLLVQVFLNLVKNAAEAAPQEGGEITLVTAYQHGIRLAVPGFERSVHLPLAVTVQDNGEGIPEDLQSNLFDPFITTKRTGTGLGLALVAKVIGDHGGVIEFETQPRRTAFKVMLPMARG